MCASPRFISFRDINEFMSELKDILNNKETKTLKDSPAEKQQKTEDKNQKPSKLSMPLDS